jgi:hypothetical protein
MRPMGGQAADMQHDGEENGVTDWAIMNWVRGNERSKVWAILPVDSRAVLPLLTERGHWEEFRKVNPERFPEREEAQEGIDRDGFYFVRESVAIGPLLK